MAVEAYKEYGPNHKLIGLLIIYPIVLFLWIYYFFYFYFYFFIDFPFLSDSPKNVFFEYFITFILILSWAFIVYLVYYDARFLNAGSTFTSEYNMTFFFPLCWPPWLWGIMVFFSPIIFFPLYMILRRRIMEKNNEVEIIKEEKPKFKRVN